MRDMADRLSIVSPERIQGELNKLLVDFQAHPRKYINLKVF
jgi:tRNA nucleotidyltransferase/poly(A) polymerase